MDKGILAMYKIKIRYLILCVEEIPQHLLKTFTLENM